MPAKLTLEYASPGEKRTTGTHWWLELLLAAVLMLVLLSLVVPARTSGRSGAARTAAARADVAGLLQQLEAFKLDVGRYPTAAEGLSALQVQPAGVRRWRGPYARPHPFTDPWGRPYGYVPPAGSSPPKVISGGPDLRVGTADDVTSP
jgi:general secretion pathway protein G